MPLSIFNPESVHPLAGVDPVLLLDDLSLLGERSGDAKIVALGEPTHGQKEINQLRDRMTRYLITNRGFRVVAMEDSAIRCRIVNDYVVHGKGTALDALTAQNFWTWKTQEILSMLEWLRSWNLEHPQDTVQFIGIDIQDLATPASDLLDLIHQLDNEENPEVTERLTRIGRVQMWDTAEFNEMDMRAHLHTVEEVRERILNSRTLSPNDLELGEACTGSLVDALKMWKAIATSSSDESPESWNCRDEAMARRALAPLQQSQKVILWAHNGHVQSEKPEGIPAGATTLGQILREALGNGYMVVSGVFGAGQYRARNPNDGRFGSSDVGEPPVGSIDYALWSTTNSTALLVDISQCSDLLFQAQTTRWAGAALVSSEEMLTEVRPAIGSDMLAFVRESTPSVNLRPV